MIKIVGSALLALVPAAIFFLLGVGGNDGDVTSKIAAATSRDAAESSRATPNEASAPRLFSSSQPLIPADEPRLAAAPKPIARSFADATQPKLTTLKPADEHARLTLVRDLQRELKRVGCYDGEFNGAWGTTSKRAMATFMERVNATLPLDEPDYVLLTLVQGHAAQVCGPSCPAGQGLSPEGKCLPRAILAQGAKRAKDRTVNAKLEPARPKTMIERPQPPLLVQPGSVGEPAAPLPGRMAIGALAEPVLSPATKAAITPPGKAASAPRTSAPAPQKSANYSPERRRWTRTIFTDVTRMR